MDSKERDELLRKLETDIWDVKGGMFQLLQNQRRLTEALEKVVANLQPDEAQLEGETE